MIEKKPPIQDPAAATKDPWQIASIIAAYAKDKGFDLIFTGMQSQDRGSAQVGVAVAEQLGYACTTTIVGFQCENGTITAKRELEGGIKGVSFPLVSDLNKTIAADYGVLLPGGVALRGLFIVNEKGILKHITVNDNSLGRNVEEVLRVVDAVDFSEKHGEVCPANWHKGEKAMKASSAGLKAYVASK